MKICLRYFSGTGNTKYVANQIAEGLGSSFDVDISSIENSPVITDHDLLIVGGPIYAGNCPEHLIRYVIRNIPQLWHG